MTNDKSTTEDQARDPDAMNAKEPDRREGEATSRTHDKGFYEDIGSEGGQADADSDSLTQEGALKQDNKQINKDDN